MPRTARAKSQSNIYHVMLRGVNKQQIFYDREDNEYFIKLLDRFRKPCGYRLFAYCLMGNHVHLLIEEGQEASLGDIFRHIVTAFVYWYNVKYERTGHLFQDRYKSEPVEDEAYLLTVFRYILMNPVRAGLCEKAEEYRYSSAGEYLNGREGITDTAYLRELISPDSMRAYLYAPNDDRCMEMEETTRKRVTDEAAEQMILRELGSMNPVMGKAKERQALNLSISRLVKAGISIRQLARLTGIPKKIIEKALE